MRTVLAACQILLLAGLSSFLSHRATAYGAYHGTCLHVAPEGIWSGTIWRQTRCPLNAAVSDADLKAAYDKLL